MLIWSGASYTVESWNSGLSYEVTRHVTGEKAASFFVQGDCADAFRDEWENVEKHFPNWHGDKVLNYLWDQHGYGGLVLPAEAKEDAS